MAINLDKMRNKLTSVQSRGQGRTSQFWRPADGDQNIRIVPTADGDPFKEFWFHYNVGKNAGFLSPKKNFGEDDPLDAFVRQLFNEGTEDSIKMAKNLMARQRFFSPIIVRGEEEKGVRLWGYGKQVYTQLLELVLNPEYGDITDPEAGTDLVLNYGKPAGMSFPADKDYAVSTDFRNLQGHHLRGVRNFTGLSSRFYKRVRPKDSRGCPAYA